MREEGNSGDEIKKARNGILNKNYQIIQVNECTWRIEEQGVRFFLLAGTERALLIDSGMQVHNAKEIAEELTDLPLELLNTHGDPDHVGSNEEFDAFYMHPAEAANYYNTQKKRGCFIPVEEGQIIDLGDRPLEIIALPGHTPGSIAVLDRKNRVLISGDPIQEGNNIFMFGVQREMHAYIYSMEKLEQYRHAFDEVWPSHGICPVKPEVIVALRDAACEVLAGEREWTDFEMHGRKVRRYDVGIAAFLCEE